jgi:hypothetical protein
MAQWKKGDGVAISPALHAPAFTGAGRLELRSRFMLLAQIHFGKPESTFPGYAQRRRLLSFSAAC